MKKETRQITKIRIVAMILKTPPFNIPIEEILTISIIKIAIGVITKIAMGSVIKTPLTYPLILLLQQYIGRGDWIRTNDPLYPIQVRYRTAPHPDTP